MLQASAVYDVVTGQRVTELFDYQWGGFLNSLTLKITATGDIDDSVFLNGPQFEACNGDETPLETLFSSRLSDFNFK